MKVDGGRVAARLTGAAIASQGKEIKAVTFHRLLIEDSHRGLRTRVVFDV
jgi:SHS2 domain-containing protein